MASKPSSSGVYAPNFSPEPTSDEALITGFSLSLGASGRKERTIYIYEESITMLSAYARDLGFPRLATIDRNVIRHWMTSLHQKGNKAGTVSVLYRSLNFFNWTVAEEERTDNPMDKDSKTTVAGYGSSPRIRDASHHYPRAAIRLRLYITPNRARGRLTSFENGRPLFQEGDACFVGVFRAT